MSSDGLRERLGGELSALATDDPDRGPVALLLAGIRRGFTGAWRLACARWSLRRCQRGRLVRTRGNPLVEGSGEIRLGDGVAIWSHLARTQLSAGPGALLSIGDHTFVNTGTSISARRGVSIGSRCQIANHVVIMDSDFHGLEDRDHPEPPEAIVIEDDVWLAVRSTVLKGVRIGRGAVVAAGAVVVDDVPPYTLVAGVPARPVKRLRSPAPAD